MNTTPTRRSAPRGATLAAIAAGLAVPALASAAPNDGADAELITLCDRIVAIQSEQEALAEADGWAPDNSPQYHALYLEWSDLVDRLQSATRPMTSDGIRAVARMAWDNAGRDANGRVISDSPCDWTRLRVIAWAAGEDEGPAMPPRHAQTDRPVFKPT